MAPGEQLEVVATDPGSARDIPAFIALSAHHLVESAVDGSQCRFVIRCGGAVNV
jgi:tRNA 2-thiouridine synthesizing protein A